MDRFEVCIVGAGAVGLAIANSLASSGDIDPEKILVLEANSGFGQGASSRNSEVIHAGIYYAPDSLKARFCLEGKALLYQFLKTHGIDYRRCGKLILAQKGQEEALEGLFANASAAGLSDLCILNTSQVSSKESQLSNCSAIFSPSTGIFDSHHYMHTLQTLAQNSGVMFAFNSEVSGVAPVSGGFVVKLPGKKTKRQAEPDYEFATSYLVNCAGLGASELAGKIDGLSSDHVPKTWLCKGDYFAYEARNPFKHLIYPIPEQNTVGLGIHSTMDLQNQLRFGPDAYYLDSEDYDVAANKADAFAVAVARYFPTIDSSKLRPAYSGIRPKLSGPGQPPQDFLIHTETSHGLKGLINLFGIESPGLTASLAIGCYVRSKIGAGH